MKAINTNTIQEQIEQAKVLWASALPDVPVPPDGTIRLWLSEHEYRMFEGSLAYAPRRVERMRKNNRYTPVAVYKYISTFLFETKRQRAEALQAQRPEAQTLLAAVKSFTPDEAQDELNTVRAYNACVLGEIVRYNQADPLGKISMTTMHNIRLLTEAKNAKTARHLTAQIVDSLESSSLNSGEATGDALRRLAELDRALSGRTKIQHGGNRA
jgi:hypothetical protein